MKRLAGTVLRCALTLLLAVTFVFVVLRLSGDPARIMLPDDTPLPVIEAYRARWGLDKPLLEQFIYYIRGLLRGDFGFSFRDNRDALTVVLDHVPPTLLLGGTALALMLLIGIPCGIFAALRRGTAADRLTMAFTIFGHSMPNFFLGILLIILFSLTLQVLPSAGNGSWTHLVMPALTLGTAGAGAVARFTRSSMLEVLRQPYMRTARAKGVPGWRRIAWHALPNAAIPIVTIIGLRVGALIGGAVVTEQVFGWPGVGLLLVNSVSQRDLAVVQTIVLMVAFTMVLVNLLIDLLYGWIDPRIRTRSRAR